MKGYAIRKVYLVICDKCNEDITRPHGDQEPETRAEAEQMARDHERIWHPRVDRITAGL